MTLLFFVVEIKEKVNREISRSFKRIGHGTQ